MESQNAKKRFTLTIDPELLKKAKIQAIQENTTFSGLVTRLLEEHLKLAAHNENKEQAPAE